MPSFAASSLLAVIGLFVISATRQLLFRRKTEPPAVFHWIPYIGNAVSYGTDPVAFFEKCREKYGDIFTFTLFGRNITCYLGLQGNDFILNGKVQDMNAEEIYGPLTIPVFGSDVVYDCPNSKLMEQKKFVKFGLTQQALEAHVPLIEYEVLDYVKTSSAWKGASGTVDVSAAMSELTLFTAARSLQGKEVREKLTADFAELYHDLDMGFTPINFLFPWLPLPRNRRRDIAHDRMRDVYEEIINQRRKDALKADAVHDMIWNLMNCKYKDGSALPDHEIAHMMITLLMGDIAEELYQEQVQSLGRNANGHLPPLRYSDLEKLPLLRNVVKETLRLHGSIHSLLRKVKNPLPIPGSPYVVGTDKVLLSSPMVTAMSDEFFPDAKSWNPHRWDDRQQDEDAAGDANDMVDYGYGIVSKGTKSPYIPFGAGRHRCIGEKFAYLNLGVIVATIIRNFRLSTLDGKTGVVPPTDHTSMFARPTLPSIIRWTRREES